MNVELRFDEIAIAVLTGQTAAAAARECGVAKHEIVPIVNNYR